MSIYCVFDDLIKEREVFEANVLVGWAKFYYLLDLVVRVPGFSADEMGAHMEKRLLRLTRKKEYDNEVKQEKEMQLIKDLVLVATTISDFFQGRDRADLWYEEFRRFQNRK